MTLMTATRNSTSQSKCYFEAPVRDSIPAIQSEWTQADRAQRAALGRVRREQLLRSLGLPTHLLPV